MQFFNGFSDWRFIVASLIAVIIMAGYLIRAYMTKRSWRAVSDDFTLLEGLILLAVVIIFNSVAWNWGVNKRIGAYTEQIGGYITAKWEEHGEHEHPEDRLGFANELEHSGPRQLPERTRAPIHL